MNVCPNTTLVRTPCLQCGHAMFVEEFQVPRVFNRDQQKHNQKLLSENAFYLRDMRELLVNVEWYGMHATASRNSTAMALCRQWEDMDRSNALQMHMEALEHSIG